MKPDLTPFFEAAGLGCVWFKISGIDISFEMPNGYFFLSWIEKKEPSAYAYLAACVCIDWWTKQKKNGFNKEIADDMIEKLEVFKNDYEPKRRTQCLIGYP